MAVTIMLIDNDRQFLNSTKSAVETLGWCELRTMTDSREAVRCLEQQKFDGVVVNVAMRYLNGFELTRRIRALPLNAGVPTVMLTVDDDVDIMRKGFKAGVTFLMVKPWTRERVHKLFASVRGVITSLKRRHVWLPYRTKVVCE